MSVTDGSVVVTDYTAESISVVWGDRTQDDVILYRIEAATEYEGTDEIIAFNQSPGVPPRYTFTDLRAGQRYVITLTVIRDQQLSDIVTAIVQYTSECGYIEVDFDWAYNMIIPLYILIGRTKRLHHFIL